MTESSCISLKETSLGYKKLRQEICILKDLNFDFFAGDFVGIVGLNGVGKSTLLKSIGSILPALSGEILIEGKSNRNYTLSQLAKKIALVLTEKVGGFNLTSFDLVAAGQIPYTNAFNHLTSEHLKVIHAAIETCGLKEHDHKLLSELSDGLFQKTVIAKALAQQTPIMLLDEPGAFLDYASKHELFILLKKLTEKEKKCVLVSSHDLDLLVKYCTKLLMISAKSVELINNSEALENKTFLEIGGGFLSRS
jgi:iron complex transport system ATP-binding protein